MSFGGGGGSTSAPNPPAPQLANIGQLENQAVSADTTGYNLSDQAFAAQFPGLVSARNQQLTDAYNQLTGPLDPNVQQSFMNQGIGQSLGSFGSGNPYATINKDTASGKAVETSLANNVQNKQNYDRTYFESLLALNPQRQIGLSGSDVANLSAANTAAQNAYLQSKYAGAYGTYSANNAAQGQQQGALLGTVGSLASAAIIAL